MILDFKIMNNIDDFMSCKCQTFHVANTIIDMNGKGNRRRAVQNLMKNNACNLIVLC